MTRRFGPVVGLRVLQVPLVAAAVALAPPAVAQNLIANGNFAVNAGDFTFNSALPGLAWATLLRGVFRPPRGRGCY